MATKRKNLSFAEKKKIIEDFEKSNLSKVAFSKQFGIARTSLNTILSARTVIEDTSNENRKRQRLSPFDKVEEALLIWIKIARSQNVPITCLVLKEKAVKIAEELGIEDFVASNGWIQRFKLRHDLTFRKICGEAGEVDRSVIEEWKCTVLSDICKRYKTENIFNVDECGLFYRLLPDKTLAFKNEKCIGGKKSKERLTVFLAANMDGSEKLSPLVIGKFKKPRCFKNVKSLPLTYEANKKSWMTTDLWEKTIRRFDRHFYMHDRKVAFIADNCTAHCQISNLKAIELIFLPPNVTSVLQPLDQGVIQNFKINYRKFLIKDMVKAIDNNDQFHVSVLDAILYIDKSWNDVSPRTIANCFSHAGFVSTLEPVESSDDEEAPLSVLAQKIRDKGLDFPDEMAYVTIDNNVHTSSDASITEIVSQVTNENDFSSDNSENDDESEIKTVSKADALTALNNVRRFLTTFEVDEEHYKLVGKLEKIVGNVNLSQRQSCITDFFK